MLEVLMTKNENNSHAFLRKMVENIKLTKDAQCPDDAKANEVTSLTCSTRGSVSSRSYWCVLHVAEALHRL